MLQFLEFFGLKTTAPSPFASFPKIHSFWYPDPSLWGMIPSKIKQNSPNYSSTFAKVYYVASKLMFKWKWLMWKWSGWPCVLRFGCDTICILVVGTTNSLLETDHHSWVCLALALNVFCKHKFRAASLAKPSCFFERIVKILGKC